MKKLFGLLLKAVAFVLMLAALTVPLTGVAYHYFGQTSMDFLQKFYVQAGAAAVLSFLLVLAGSFLPPKKFRIIFALIFGLGAYGAAAWLAVYGPANSFDYSYLQITENIGLNVNNISFLTDIDMPLLIAAGGLAILAGILIAALSRALIRKPKSKKKEDDRPSVSSKTPPVANVFNNPPADAAPDNNSLTRNPWAKNEQPQQQQYQQPQYGQQGYQQTQYHQQQQYQRQNGQPYQTQPHVTIEVAQPERMVRDPWGNQITESEYNRRINNSKK